MSVEIVHRYTGAVLYRSETAETARECTEQAVRDGANLVRANLGGADLGGANLWGADLGGANLGGANLGGANLVRANLGGANLVRADLVRADLGGADLVRANLGGANLVRANLGGADLGGANLWGANLVRANLCGADLGGADLGGANLGDLRVLQIAGSQHWIVALLSPDGCEVRIGCKHHPLAWWLDHYRSVGEEEEKYMPAQIDEYGRHLAYVQEWAKYALEVKG